MSKLQLVKESDGTYTLTKEDRSGDYSYFNITTADLFDVYCIIEDELEEQRELNLSAGPDTNEMLDNLKIKWQDMFNSNVEIKHIKSKK